MKTFKLTDSLPPKYAPTTPVKSVHLASWMFIFSTCISLFAFYLKIAGYTDSWFFVSFCIACTVFTGWMLLIVFKRMLRAAANDKEE